MGINKRSNKITKKNDKITKTRIEYVKRGSALNILYLDMIIVLEFEQFVLKNDALEARLSNIQLYPKLKNQQQIKSTTFQINVRSPTPKPAGNLS